jgi:hypothetical protein
MCGVDAQEILVSRPQVKEAARKRVVARGFHGRGSRHLELRAAPTGAPIHHFTCARTARKGGERGASSALHENTRYHLLA